jgi:hypothetical protein
MKKITMRRQQASGNENRSAKKIAGLQKRQQVCEKTTVLRKRQQGSVEKSSSLWKGQQFCEKESRAAVINSKLFVPWERYLTSTPMVRAGRLS